MSPSQASSAQAQLPLRVYRFRMLGMGVSSLPVALVLERIGWTPWTLAFLAFTAVAWPQLAWLLARRSANPFRAELRNLMGDSLIAGLWVPLMHFNLLPSALLLTVVTADKINTGVRGLWLRALPAMVLGVLAGALATGFAVQLPTDTATILACLPLLAVHTLAVSISTYQLVRKVQRHNRQLLELSRKDPLTGLANRRYWHEESLRRLAERGARGEPSTLLMIDMDKLKAINDQHGHAAGDEVLGTLAALIRAHAGAGAPAAASGVAERLREAMATARWPDRPELRCTISLGLSDATGAADTLPHWSENADRALYRAKQAGRNRSIAGDGAAALTPPR